MQHIYLITHCESCYNRCGLFTGRINSHLTDEGIRHAKIMAERMKHVHLDLAICTSLQRTKETLSYILKFHKNCKIEIDDRMIERDYGTLSRRNKKKYEREHPDMYPIYHRSYEIPPPDGESIKDVEYRVLPFLQEVIARMKRERIDVLLVCHGNSIRPMIRFFEHISIEDMLKLEYSRHKIFHYHI